MYIYIYIYIYMCVCVYIYIVYVCNKLLHLNFLSTGNFGIVHEAWHTKGNTQTKVAIKTLKGN